MLKQSEMLMVDYKREFLRLSKYATKFLSFEVENCKWFLRGLRDKLRVQLVSYRISEFTDLVE